MSYLNWKSHGFLNVTADLIILVSGFCLTAVRKLNFIIPSYYVHIAEPSQFCAYIGYYYDRENGHLQEITTIYKEVMEFLNKIGGPLYDKEQIPSDVEGKFNSINLIYG